MDLLIGLTEALGRLKVAKPQGGIVTLLNAPMTLLNRIAQTGDYLVLHLHSQFLFDGSGIRAVSIGEHPFRGDIGHVLSLLKEGFRRFHISCFTQPRIHQIPLLIDAAIEIAPPSLDSKIRLIHMPDVAHLPFTRGS